MIGKNRKLNIRNNQGMTLIEVIVAMTIIVIVSGALLTGFRTNFNILQRGVNNQKAGEALDSAVYLKDFRGVSSTKGEGNITFSIRGEDFLDKDGNPETDDRELAIYTTTQKIKTKTNENVQFDYFAYDTKNTNNYDEDKYKEDES